MLGFNIVVLGSLSKPERRGFVVGLPVQAKAEIKPCIHVSLVGSESIPTCGRWPASLHAPSIVVHSTEIILGVGKPLGRSTAEPFEGLGVICSYTSTGVVHQANIVLSCGISLVCRDVVPVGSGTVVLFEIVSVCGI
jgi:hypothetical protein